MDSQERKQMDAAFLLFWSSFFLCGIKKTQTTLCREKEQLTHLFSSYLEINLCAR